MATGYCGECRNRNEDGYCTSEKMTEEWGDGAKTDDALVYSYMEGGSFWVGEKFGCVHFAITLDNAEKPVIVSPIRT